MSVHFSGKEQSRAEWFREHRWRRIPVEQYSQAKIDGLLRDGGAGIYFSASAPMGGWN